MASLYYGIVIRIPITLKAKANHRAWVTCLFQHALAYSSTKKWKKQYETGLIYLVRWNVKDLLWKNVPNRGYQTKGTEGVLSIV